MEIFHELNHNPNLSLALGYFDGVHIGHQAVIKNAVDFAKKNNCNSAVITFSDHPFCYFKGVCPKYILTKEDRENKIKELGIDFLYEIDFANIANLSADEYLKNILIEYFSPLSISTGWNHNFGKNKSGNIEFLKSNTKIYNYKYFALPAEKLENKIISSTEIRNYLASGDINSANQMLGYKFSINGKITKGNQIGRTIGFKTANIDYPNELITLPYGVYSVNTNFGKGIANFGTRPTINGEKPLIEVHILNFDKDIYGQNINIEFNKMIRQEQKFKSLNALKEQIKKDIDCIN